MNRADRIKKQEAALDTTIETVESVKAALELLEKNFKKVEMFTKYYGSEDWFRDYDANAEGRISEDIKCGVLSEDIPYDTILELKDSSLKMLELAAGIIKLI